MKRALLLSGGMDSVCLAYWLRPEVTVTVDYGQRPAAGELRAAKAVAAEINSEHLEIHVDLRPLGSGDLAGTPALSIGTAPEWWPYRNQMLLTLAAMKVIALDVRVLLIGALLTDGFHSDGRADFVEAMSRVLQLQEGGLRVEAPAITMTAAELVARSEIPAEILAWAHSCHVSEFACGSCRGCVKHYETFEALGRAPY
jgi:7-cyano-7-deazaguanine synthase